MRVSFVVLVGALLTAGLGCPSQKVAANQPYFAYPAAPEEPDHRAQGYTRELRDRLDGDTKADRAVAPVEEPVDALVERLYR